MEKKVDEKLDSLQRYVPLIEYLLQLDKEKYEKFINIKQWILDRKRYPMNVLQKMEQSITTQYRNLFLHDGKVPTHIMDIFNNHSQSEIKIHRVNLCSDDEEEEDKSENKDNENDDDVIIVSTSPPPTEKPIKPEKQSQANKYAESNVRNVNTSGHISTEEPICLDSDDDDGGGDQRGDVNSKDNLNKSVTSEDSILTENKLFKRRQDFEEIESLERQLAVVDKIDEILNKQNNDNADDDCYVAYDDDQLTEGPSEKQKYTDKTTNDMLELSAKIEQHQSKVDRQKPEQANSVEEQHKELEQQPRKEIEQQHKELEQQQHKKLEQQKPNDEQNKTQPENIEAPLLCIAQPMDLNEASLESMDIENLRKVYEDLTKNCPIDVENLLKSINLVQSPSKKFEDKNLNNMEISNYTPQQMPMQQQQQRGHAQQQQQQLQKQYSPNYANIPMPAPYPQLKTVDLQHRTNNMPLALTIPPQPFKLNLKDPRILRLLETNKSLPLPPALNPADVSAGGSVAVEKPTTYGEYKRLKAEQEKKKLEDQKRAMEAKKAEEENKALEASKRAEDATKGAQKMKIVEEIKRTQTDTQKREFSQGMNNTKDETRRIEELKDEISSSSTCSTYNNAKTNENVVTPNTSDVQNAAAAVVEKIPAIKNEILQTICEKLLEDNRVLKLLERKQNVKIVADDVTHVSSTKEDCAYKADKKSKSKKERTKIKEKIDALKEKNAKNRNKASSPANMPPILKEDNAKLGNISSSPPDGTQEKEVDLKSMILETILPYGDQILDVLSRNVADVQPNMTTEALPEQRQAESPTTTTTSSFDKLQQEAYEYDTDVHEESKIADERRNEEIVVKKTKTLKRRAKRKNSESTKRCYKRIRTISSSSSASSTKDVSISPPQSRLESLSAGSLSSTSDPTTPKTSNKVWCPKLNLKTCVILERLSPATISKYTAHPKSQREEQSKTITVQLVEDVTKTKKLAHHLIESKPAKLNVKYKNVDSLMTSNNTTFCALCKSRPSDLTNHYRRVHKTESYVARLNSTALRTLSTNVPFAKLLTKSAKCKGAKKYSVKCAFCKDDIEDKFINFYEHFSTHTGEYGYQCSICKMEKPYEFDIKSHKYHTKTCRNARIQTLYQYPPNGLVIYSYSCKICNFVQLNEANTFKHLRDHHDKRQDDSKFIKKFILAAINDEEEEEEDEEPAKSKTKTKTSSDGNVNETDAKFEFPKADDDILVRNEALCSEDMLEFASTNENESHSIDEMFAKMLQTAQRTIARSEGDTLTNSSAMVKLPAANYAESQRKGNENTDILHTNILETTLQTMNAKKLSKEQNECKYIPPLSAMENLLMNYEYDIKTECLPPDTLSLENETEIGNEIEKDKEKEEKERGKEKEKDNCISKDFLYNSHQKSYRQYPNGVSYFGLFKCMATDCLYSTDSNQAILQHLNEHRKSEWPPEDYLQCAYCCKLDAVTSNTFTPEMLIEHIQTNHKQSQYQCSLCCYRAILPNYVFAHARISHPLQEGQVINVFKCTTDSSFNENSDTMPTNVMHLLNENVKPFICPFQDCLKNVYSIMSMQEHLIQIHSLHRKSEYIANLERYACIYCSRRMRDMESVKNHLVACHPDQQPYVCERTLLNGKVDDLVQNLKVVSVALPDVPCENVQVVVKQELDVNGDDSQLFSEMQEFYNVAAEIPAMPAATEANSTTIPPTPTAPYEMETKPNIAQLLETAEECVKVSLLKLTGGTGISPNLLYHCPQPTCGGFFSTYDLWQRHMSRRHCCLISVCPHCPNDKKQDMPLADFRQHFEQHCCHLYGCFHCGETFATEFATREHITHAHINANAAATGTVDFGLKMGVELHCEKVPLYFGQPFNVLMKDQPLDRYCFLLELQDVVQKRCKLIEKLYKDSMKTQWIVPFTALWLEKFPSFTNNDNIRRRCFCRNCTFQTYDNEMFYEHLRTSHRLVNEKFVCAKCDFRISCENWEPIIEHIRMHVLDIHICCVCSYYHHDRRKLYAHLQAEHRFRDVPLVTIIRSSECVQVAISNAFGEMRKTFSTIKTCFICAQSTDTNTGDTYAGHLKKSHALTLQYFCEICDQTLKLAECDEHFFNAHPREAPRLRCQFATNNQLIIDTIEPLKLHIEEEPCSNVPFLYQNNLNINKFVVKQELCDNETAGAAVAINSSDSNDDDIEMIDDDDIIIANEVKMFTQQKQQQQHEKGGGRAIRCVNVANLVQSSNNQRWQQTLPLQTPVQTPFLGHVQTPHLVQPPQTLPQLLSPPPSNIMSSNTTGANGKVLSPRYAIQSHDPNFSDNFNLRPVQIMIRPNSNNNVGGGGGPFMDILANPTTFNSNFQYIGQ